MPKALEDKLKKEAEAKGYSGDRENAYVYGTLRKTGWKPKRERKKGSSSSGSGSGIGKLY